MSSISALLYHSLENVNWIGFYLVKDGRLSVGPFQGKPACIHIKKGEGVCGTAWAEDRTVLVENVHEFPGHIACDSASNSEIVLPIHDRSGAVAAVLDADSPLFSRFTENDREGLLSIVRDMEALIVFDTRCILTEYSTEKGIIYPEKFFSRNEKMPKTAVAFYSTVNLERLLAAFEHEQIAAIHGANGHRPIYRIVFQGKPVAVFLIGVGAPLSVGDLEDVHAMGVENFIVFGTCGTLDSSIEDCEVILPDAALRDEGVSYHYAAAADEIPVNRKHLKQVKELLDEMGYNYYIGKTWTTDGFYRETPSKMARRKAQGAICVDMECSANAAVAAFRGFNLIQFLYSADNLDAAEWDERSLGNFEKVEVKDKFARIALTIAQKVFPDQGMER